MSDRTCIFPGCAKPLACRGYCSGHYEQFRTGKTLKPLGGAALTTMERFERRVQRGAGCWEWSGARNRGGYGIFPTGRTHVPAHRFAYEAWVAPIPDGMVIDHICLNRACVNPAHLRAATYKQNNENRLGAERTNRSGVRGVSWSAGQKAWRARVTHDDVTYHLGYFESKEEAGEVARLKRLELFTHNEIDRAS